MKYHVSVLPDVIAKKRPYCFDEKGIIMEKTPYTQEYNYNPTMIACYVIRTGDEANMEWLRDNMDSDGCLHHHYTLPYGHDLPDGWIGGLTQGLTASAFAMQDDMEYAEKASHGLLLNCYHDGIVFERPGHLILNGWIYAIFGLHDAGCNIDPCIDALVSMLPEFDCGYWSLYDTEKMIAPVFYHNVHVQQLQALHRITGKRVFQEYSRRWSNGTVWRAHFVRTIQHIRKHGMMLPVQAYRRWRWKK